MDSHGNASEFAALPPAAPTGIGGSDRVFALHGVRPNPSTTGAIRVDCTLAVAAPAHLEVVDLAGRRVATRRLDGLQGRQSIEIAGPERLRPGVYLIRLVQGSQARETKAIVAP